MCTFLNIHACLVPHHSPQICHSHVTGIGTAILNCRFVTGSMTICQGTYPESAIVLNFEQQQTRAASEGAKLCVSLVDLCGRPQSVVRVWKTNCLSLRRKPRRRQIANPDLNAPKVYLMYKSCCTNRSNIEHDGIEYGTWNLHTDEARLKGQHARELEKKWFCFAREPNSSTLRAGSSTLNSTLVFCHCIVIRPMSQHHILLPRGVGMSQVEF